MEEAGAEERGHGRRLTVGVRGGSERQRRLGEAGERRGASVAAVRRAAEFEPASHTATHRPTPPSRVDVRRYRDAATPPRPGSSQACGPALAASRCSLPATAHARVVVVAADRPEAALLDVGTNAIAARVALPGRARPSRRRPTARGRTSPPAAASPRSTSAPARPLARATLRGAATTVGDLARRRARLRDARPRARRHRRRDDAAARRRSGCRAPPARSRSLPTARARWSPCRGGAAVVDLADPARSAARAHRRRRRDRLRRRRPRVDLLADAGAQAKRGSCRARRPGERRRRPRDQASPGAGRRRARDPRHRAFVAAGGPQDARRRRRPPPAARDQEPAHRPRARRAGLVARRRPHLRRRRRRRDAVRALRVLLQAPARGAHARLAAARARRPARARADHRHRRLRDAHRHVAGRTASSPSAATTSCAPAAATTCSRAAPATTRSPAAPAATSSTAATATTAPSARRATT